MNLFLFEAKRDGSYVKLCLYSSVEQHESKMLHTGTGFTSFYSMFRNINATYKLILAMI